MRASVLLAAVAATLASAAPSANDEISIMKRNIIERLSTRSQLAKRQSTTTGATDAIILNFALTLEHLEAAFYGQALAKFNASSFNSAGYTGAYELLAQVSADESQHVSFLTTALNAAGVTPVQACNYTFPYTDVASFLGLSQVLEGTGVSAYLGAANDIQTPGYITAAGSILTVEARHNAFIRFINGYSPFPSPEDTPLSAAAIVTIATPFFASCPEGSAPAIAGHPALNLSTTAPTVGSAITIAPVNSTLLASNSGTVYCGFASGLGAGFSTWTNNSCMVPTSNVTDGQTYVFLTSGPSVSDASVLAGPAIVNLGAHNYSVTLNGAAAIAVTGTSSAGGSSPTSKTGAASSLAYSVAAGLSAIAGAVALLV